MNFNNCWLLLKTNYCSQSSNKQATLNRSFKLVFGDMKQCSYKAHNHTDD